MGRYAVRTGLARIEELAKQVEAGTLPQQVGSELYAEITKVLKQAVKDELAANPAVDRQTLKALDRAEKIVYGKRYADLYIIQKRLLDKGYTVPPSAAPVVKQQPLTPRQQADLDATTAAQQVLAAGRADNL